MIIQKFGEYIMRGRREAALMAFIWTLIPFMGWLGVVIMAMVTLRKGAFEGLLVLLWTILPSIVYAFMGYHMPLIYGVLCGSLVAWILAIVLRETHSWALVLQIATLIGIIAVASIHAVMPGLNQYWTNLFTKYYTDAESALALKVTAGELKTLIAIMAKIATGTQAVVLLFIAMINLLIARWWQSTLFHPGGLAKELYGIRLGFLADAALLLIIVAILMGLTPAWDLLPLILILFFVAGLSLIHALARMSKVMWAWLLGYYGLLIIFFPYIGAITVILAIADTFTDFRSKVKNRLAKG